MHLMDLIERIVIKIRVVKLVNQSTRRTEKCLAYITQKLVLVNNFEKSPRNWNTPKLESSTLSTLLQYLIERAAVIDSRCTKEKKYS